MSLHTRFLATIAAFCIVLQAQNQLPTEQAAIDISRNIQARHVPWGGILDPVYTLPTDAQPSAYTHCGDSALWTGAYLAAESFRYRVTQSPEALQNVKTAVSTLTTLTDVTGDNRLARCLFPSDSPWAVSMENEEAHNGIHEGGGWVWIGDTSRDQIVGAFFGLGVAFDMVDDQSVRSSVSALATRLIAYISRHDWSPNGDLASTFELRPESLQMLLQVARHVNPKNKVSGPFWVPPVDTGVFVDTLSNDSYFKFNLDYMALYHLVRLQPNSDNRHAYNIVRAYTASHQNAFFDAVDLALTGVNPSRDTESRSLLAQWLQRPLRNGFVNLARLLPVCGSNACLPVPVAMRPPTDYLWQRSPFQISGGSALPVESAGIDYILPYWMCRYFGSIASDPAPPTIAAQ